MKSLAPVSQRISTSQPHQEDIKLLNDFVANAWDILFNVFPHISDTLLNEKLGMRWMEGVDFSASYRQKGGEMIPLCSFSCLLPEAIAHKV